STQSSRRRDQTDRADSSFCFVMHSFSVDDHPKTLSPSRHLKRYLEVTHPASQRMPALALTDQRQETQPLEKRHLDRIVCVPALQKLQDFPLEKRPVHAKLQRDAPSQSHSQILDQIAQETYRPFGIMNIARSILHPHNVSGLSQMSQ